MLAAIAIATVVAAVPPADNAGLPIRGVTVQQSMPPGVTHIEAPPFRAYKVQAMTAPATTSPSPKPQKKR